MKNFIRFIGVVGLIMYGFSQESYAINVSTLSSQETSCSEANVNAQFYISGSSGTFFLYDSYFSSEERVISKNNSNVKIWQSDSNLITGCTTDSNWHRISTYAPGNNTSVIAIGANCTFNKPTDGSKRTLQFVYNIANYGITSGAGNYTLQYFTNTGSMDSNTPDGQKSFTNISFDDYELHGNGCYNVELQYCGDGVINGSETCDINDTSQTGWGTQGCSSSCQTDNTAIGGGGSSGGGSGGGGSGSGGGGSSSSVAVCGDGIIQRPNDNGDNEQCDFGSVSDWGVCNKATCKWGDITISGHYNGDITVPNNGRIVFGPKGSTVIGHGMNPFVETLQRPYVLNESDFEVYFDEICVSKSSTSVSLNGISPQCRTVGLIAPGEKFVFSGYPNFKGNKDFVFGSYGDNTLLTTLRHGGILYDFAYFAAPFKVRVSKPSIATVGGGTSVVQDTSNIANIKDVADTLRDNLNKGENDNFVGAGVSTGSISSSTKVVTDEDSVNKILEDGEKKEQNIDDVIEIDETGLSNMVTTDINDFENYNGMSNVFILKNKNFKVLGDTFDSLAGERTYIIDEGTLIIEDDIVYPSNIAFVVRGGDIQVLDTVTHLEGTYIAIKRGVNGGNIVGTGGETNQELKIIGALYGNINGLVDKRVYINEGENGQINVGTIVSFGSRLFRRPAPLTSQFIDDYIESQKVAE